MPTTLHFCLTENISLSSPFLPALHGHPPIVKTLLTSGQYKTDEQDSCGTTPLMEALRMGHLDTADLLLSRHGADLRVRDRMGRTGLHVAAEAGQEKVVRRLVTELGVDVNVKSSQGGLFFIYYFLKQRRQLKGEKKIKKCPMPLPLHFYFLLYSLVLFLFLPHCFHFQFLFLSVSNVWCLHSSLSTCFLF